MILSCPACATSYFVDDAKIGSAGRTVRCAACGERWLASPSQERQEGQEGVSAPRPQVTAEQRATGAASRRAQRAAEILNEDAAEPTPQTSLLTEESPLMFAALPMPSKKAGLKISPMVITGIMAVGLAALIVAGLVVRSDVMRLWPRSASAYALVGLAPNPAGLTLEGIKTDRVLKDGRAGLAVVGSIRNVSDRAKIAPPLRVTLTDKDGKPLLVQIGTPDGVTIPVGAVRYFSMTIIDPPPLAFNLDVDFVIDSPVQTAPEPQDSAVGPEVGAVNGGVAKEVKPLPANSPYALPTHAGAGEGDHADKMAPATKGQTEKHSTAKPVANGH